MFFCTLERLDVFGKISPSRFFEPRLNSPVYFFTKGDGRTVSMDDTDEPWPQMSGQKNHQQNLLSKNSQWSRSFVWAGSWVTHLLLLKIKVSVRCFVRNIQTSDNVLKVFIWILAFPGSKKPTFTFYLLYLRSFGGSSWCSFTTQIRWVYCYCLLEHFLTHKKWCQRGKVKLLNNEQPRTHSTSYVMKNLEHHSGKSYAPNESPEHETDIMSRKRRVTLKRN